jgi:hypothetical protein
MGFAKRNLLPPPCGEAELLERRENNSGGGNVPKRPPTRLSSFATLPALGEGKKDRIGL